MTGASRIRIVVLDGFTLSPSGVDGESPDHPSWRQLAALGDLTIHPRAGASEVVDLAAGADVLLTNKVSLDAGVFQQLPRLRYVGVMATGTNVVDLNAAATAGVVVTNVPGYSTSSVAQTVVAILLELAVRTGETAAAVREGAWAACPDFSFSLGPWRELEGKTLGILGMGAIGSRVAAVARALGMSVVYHTRTRRDGGSDSRWVTFDELLEVSDVMTLHCPLTMETRECITERSLGRMKPSAFLINTARGGLVDESAVARALTGGTLGGFGADVLVEEPPPPGHPLIAAPRTVILPHLAWASVEARKRLMDGIVSNLEGFLEGKPVNVVAGPSVVEGR